jgi:Ulp1 family protease
MATIANQNGRHMVQYVLFPVNIHFHWNLFIFELLTIYFDFILAAILKILKTKSTTLSDDLFLYQVSKGSAVRSEFNIFCTLAIIRKIIKTRFDCVWMQTQKSPNEPHIRIQGTNQFLTSKYS